MAHLGRRLRVSLNYSDITLAVRAKTTAVCQNIEF